MCDEEFDYNKVIDFIDNLFDGFSNHLLKELVMNVDGVDYYIYENHIED